MNSSLSDSPMTPHSLLERLQKPPTDPLSQIAQMLNKSMAAVYKEKSLILRQLRQDLDGLVTDA